MRPIRALSAGSLLFAATLTVSAQTRKPGLYELTLTTTTISPSPAAEPARTWNVCLTQETIDKYGAVMPDNVSKLCQYTNVVKKPNGMTSDIVCSGSLTGKGEIEINWLDSEHTKGKVHFSGTMQPGEAPIKLEWNATISAAYKGPDCGDLKPAAPSSKPATP
jgi:Protein of unknown function (DUF3617)